MRTITLLLAAAVIASCVSYNTQLTDSAGKVAHCNQTGFGIIGSLYTMNSHDDCVNKYTALGYK